MKKKINTEKKIRLRFPPSPTGPLHMGNARTLLFNYLFAKKYGGEIVLRIEDTDTVRSELKYVQDIIAELQWLGIEWNEGPDVGGKFGPYKQSQRLDIYKEYLEKLLAEKKAYYCDCAPEDLEAKRQDQMSRGLAPKYDGKCRSLGKTQGVIRFHVESKKVKFNDLIRGDVEFDMGLVGDMVIAKNVMEPLYNFAVVVDDALMQISHVIRGEDHIANTPKQMLLQQALSFDSVLYAHLPLLLNPDKSKMSKRVGDVAVGDYHKNGYLPEAIINFMALLGWNPGTEKDIFTLPELMKEFSIEKVQKSGAVFNLQKLDYLNGYYIREKSTGALVKLCLPFLPKEAEDMPAKQLEKMVEAYKARLKKLSEITELTDFFFVEKLNYDPKMLAWKTMESGEVKASLEHSAKVLSDANLPAGEAGKWDKESLEKLLVKEATTFAEASAVEGKNPDKGKLLWPLRVALSGKESSASPFEIAEILGREKSLQRIQDALDKLS